MKKILFYTESMRRGGAERVMSVIANYFAEDKYDVVLITELPIKNDDTNYKISDKIKTYCIGNNGNFIKKNINKVKSLRSIIIKEKPNVVLSFLGNQNIRMMVATWGLKCKKYISVRNDPAREYPSFFKKRLVSILFKKCTGCVFQTDDAKLFFNKKIQEKSIIIPNPISEKFYQLNQISNPKNIITVGRLENQKNHKLLIDAYKELKNVKDKLLIFGDGNLREELQKYINDNDLMDKVFLMGNSDSIENELIKAKIFVLSSDYEGMPNSLMEAMAVGLPCISTDCPCGGPRFLIRNNKEGTLISIKNKDEMVRAIEEMLTCNYKKIGMNAKSRAESFKETVILKKWEEYLFK